MVLARATAGETQAEGEDSDDEQESTAVVAAAAAVAVAPRPGSARPGRAALSRKARIQQLLRPAEPYLLHERPKDCFKIFFFHVEKVRARACRQRRGPAARTDGVTQTHSATTPAAALYCRAAVCAARCLPARALPAAPCAKHAVSPACAVGGHASHQASKRQQRQRCCHAAPARASQPPAFGRACSRMP